MRERWRFACARTFTADGVGRARDVMGSWAPRASDVREGEREPLPRSTHSAERRNSTRRMEERGMRRAFARSRSKTSSRRLLRGGVRRGGEARRGEARRSRGQVRGGARRSRGGPVCEGCPGLSRTGRVGWGRCKGAACAEGREGGRAERREGGRAGGREGGRSGSAPLPREGREQPHLETDGTGGRRGQPVGGGRVAAERPLVPAVEVQRAEAEAAAGGWRAAKGGELDLGGGDCAHAQRVHAMGGEVLPRRGGRRVKGGRGRVVGSLVRHAEGQSAPHGARIGHEPLAEVARLALTPAAGRAERLDAAAGRALLAP